MSAPASMTCTRPHLSVYHRKRDPASGGLYPAENNDGGPLNRIPFGPSSLMCLRLFMLRVTGFSTVEQRNQRLLTKNSTSLTAATA